MVARSVATVRGRPTSNVFSVISRRPFHSSTWAFFFRLVRPPIAPPRRGRAPEGPAEGRGGGHVWRASRSEP